MHGFYALAALNSTLFFISPPVRRPYQPNGAPPAARHQVARRTLSETDVRFFSSAVGNVYTSYQPGILPEDFDANANTARATQSLCERFLSLYTGGNGTYTYK